MLKLGISVSQAIVAKYMVRHPKPPSQIWCAFLKNHTQQLVSIDFFTVQTISFRILQAFLVLSHERRRVIHFNVTSHPTAEWTSQQLLHNAFPYDSAPQHIIRDRDCIYGEAVQVQLRELGIQQAVAAPRSPWQTPYVERLIGSVRRKCLDHIVTINEASLRATLRSCFSYYHDSRCHLELDKDSPEHREILSPDKGSIVEIPKVGGLHYRYDHRAARLSVFGSLSNGLRLAINMLAYPISRPFMTSSSMPLLAFWRILASPSSARYRLNTGRCGQMRFLVTTGLNCVSEPMEFVVAGKDAPTALELLAHLDYALPDEQSEEEPGT